MLLFAQSTPHCNHNRPHPCLLLTTPTSISSRSTQLVLWRSQYAQTAAGARTSSLATRPLDAALVQPISQQPTPLEPCTGYVPREAELANVPPAFTELLDSIVAAFKSACGPRLLGVYLRGSLPRNLFIPGISDVDTFAVVLPHTPAATTSTPPHNGSTSSSNGSTSSSSSPSAGGTTGDSSQLVSLQDMQAAVKQLCDQQASIQAHQHALGFTKVELKVLQVQPGSTAATALANLLAASVQDTLDSSSIVLPPSMCAAVPCAFELRVQSVCLWGLDLPQLLNPCAALPPCYEVMPSLTDSVEDARAAVLQAAAAAAAAAAGGGTGGRGESNGSSNNIGTGAVMAAAAAAAVPGPVEVQVRATKWVLKRMLRAAFELVQDKAGFYSRDLYWCCEAAKQHMPQLLQDVSWAGRAAAAAAADGTDQQQQQQVVGEWQQQLDRALELYVQLQSSLLHLQSLVEQQQQQQEQQQEEGTMQADPAAAANAAATSAAAVISAAQQQLQQLVHDSWRLVDLLLPRLETLFLKAMLREEPGWLTKHTGRPIPAAAPGAPLQGNDTAAEVFSSSSSSSSGGGSSDASAGVQQQQQQQQAQQDPWLFAGKAFQALSGLLSNPAANAAVAGAGGGAGGAITHIVGARPPAVHVPVAGSVAAYDWQQQQGRADGVAAVRSILFNQQGFSSSSSSSGTVAATTQNPSRSPTVMSHHQGGGSAATASTAAASATSAAIIQAELLSSWPQPVLLKGAAAAWPCVMADTTVASAAGGAAAVSGTRHRQWAGLQWLAQQQGFYGRVRVAPSLQFPFVEPQLLDLLLKLRGAQAAPSILVDDMSAAEFVQRLQPGGSRNKQRHIAHQPTEHYYWQADLPQHLQQDLGLDGLLQTFGGMMTDDAREPQQQQQQQQRQRKDEGGLVLTQQPRLWVSPAGAVSPLHYDTSHSFLVQVVGVKQMLFFSPDQLHRLYCYPNTHLLRRRSRVNLSAPREDASSSWPRFPLFSDAAALEVVLHPGDVLCFPSYWSHYTESLGEGVLQRGDAAISGTQMGVVGAPAGCCMSVTFRCQAAPA